MGVQAGAGEPETSHPGDTPQSPSVPVHDAFSGWLDEPVQVPEPSSPPSSYQPSFTPPPAQDAGRRNLPRRERSARPLSDEGQGGIGDQPPGSPAAVDGTPPWWAPPGGAAGAGPAAAAPSRGPGPPGLPQRSARPGPPGSIMPFSLPGESGPADPSFNLFDSPSDGRSGDRSRPVAARAPEPVFPAPPPQVPIEPMPIDAGSGAAGSPFSDPRGPAGPLPRRQPSGGRPTRIPQPSGLSELTPPPGYLGPDEAQPPAYQPSAFQPPAPLPARTPPLSLPSPQGPAPQLPPLPPPPPIPVTPPVSGGLPERPAPGSGLPQRTPPVPDDDVYYDPRPSMGLRELEDPPPATFAEVLNPTTPSKRRSPLGGYRPPRRPSNRLGGNESGPSLTPFPDSGAAAAATAAASATGSAAAAAAGAAGAAAAAGAATGAGGAEAGTGVAAGAGLAAVQAAAAARLASMALPDAADDDGTHIMPATTRRQSRSAGRSRGRTESPAETTGEITGETRRSRRTGEQPRVIAAPDAAELEPVEPVPSSSEPAAATLEQAHGRAGRNLPAAIAVGVVLAGLALASLFTRPEAFVALASLVVVLAVWELAGAMAAKQITVPVIPLAVGSLGMLVSAYVAGEEGLLVSFALTGFGVLLWRIIDGVPGAARDVTAGLFTAAYIPLLAGFAVLLLADPDGPNRVVVFILVTVASDIGGYVAGVLAGRTPMAPTISPKKSWEGFAGSVLTCLIVGVVCMFTLLDGPWWAGLAVGAAAAVTATVGDLSESLIKRDLGVKDMGSLLPGHGGIMDRLDSLLPTAPVVFLLLHYLVK